jgi:hypothetical protein
MNHLPSFRNRRPNGGQHTIDPGTCGREGRIYPGIGILPPDYHVGGRSFHSSLAGLEIGRRVGLGRAINFTSQCAPKVVQGGPGLFHAVVPGPKIRHL